MLKQSCLATALLRQDGGEQLASVIHAAKYDTLCGGWAAGDEGSDVMKMKRTECAA